MFKMLIILFRNKPDNQTDAIKINFFKILGQLLAETTSVFFNQDTVEILAELRSCISDLKLLEDVIILISCD